MPTLFFLCAIVRRKNSAACLLPGTNRLRFALHDGQRWRETGCQEVINDLLRSRRFEFPLERAIFLTVLHRLLCLGSDQAAERWREDYAIDGVETHELHHLCRAMAWLGEALTDQKDATPFSPRCTKD